MRRKFLRDAVIVLVLLGGLAAIGGPNLYTAMQRSKQKRTYATLRDWGNAIDDYRSQHGTYPAAGYYGDIEALTPLISRKVPAVDGWRHPLIYHATASHYAIRSTARDGVNDHHIEPAVTTRFDDDALYADGGFVRVTEGICGDGSRVDDWDVKKYGECASCHPAHVRHS